MSDMSDQDDYPVPPGEGASWEELQRWSNIALLAESCRKDFETFGIPITRREAWKQATKEYEKLRS